MKKSNSVLKAGNKVLIRTVTMAHLGEVVYVDGEFICLKNGGWLADTGRFSTALAEGKVSEFERVPGEFLVARGGVIDIFSWDHEIPSKTI